MRSLICRTVVLTLAVATLLATAPAHAQLFGNLSRFRDPILFTQPYPGVLPQNRLLWLINDTRAANGLAALTPVNEMTEAASFLAGDMFKMGRASHTDSYGRDGGQRLQLVGYNWSYWGEIIGESWANDSADGLWTEQDMLNWWMNSPPHRANILNPNFTEIGIGITTGATGGNGSPLVYHRYWCVDFGRR